MKIIIKKEDLPKPRRAWYRNPSSKVKPSGKIYNRKKNKKVKHDF